MVCTQRYITKCDVVEREHPEHTADEEMHPVHRLVAPLSSHRRISLRYPIILMVT